MTQSKYVMFSALCLKCSCVRVNSQADRKRARGSHKKVMYTGSRGCRKWWKPNGMCQLNMR